MDDKGKAIEELHKKRKFTHSNESYSKKFGTIVSHSSKDAAPIAKVNRVCHEGGESGAGTKGQ